MRLLLLGAAAFSLAVSTALAQTTAGSSTTIIVPVVAKTGSYNSEVTLFNPNASALEAMVSYFDANNLPTAGAKVCASISMPARRSVQFDLAGQCALEPGNHFGLLVIFGNSLTQEFFGYVRTQNPQGIGFSTEGFPVEGFSDAVSHVIGLKRTAGGGGQPPFQTNCFVASLGQLVYYQLRLFDGSSGAQIGNTVNGWQQPYTQYRFLDVFGPSGVNAPLGDYTNVRAEFTTVEGKPLIGFCTVQENQTFGAEFRIAKSMSAAVTGTGGHNTITTVDTVGGVTASSLALGADGLPVIGYYDAGNGDLKVAKCVNPACTASTRTTVDSAGDVGRYPSLTLGADGLPVLSYYDATNGDLKVAKCGNAACSGGNTITIVDSMGDVGRYTSIALGADGLPVISYYDSTSRDLKVAKCGDATCGSGNVITVVDSSSDAGAYSSIARGADGLPVIGYAWSGSAPFTNALRVAKCTDAACRSSTIATVATGAGGMTFGYASIVLGSDGLPVISYGFTWAEFLGSDGWLKVTKCGNAACSSGNTNTQVDWVGDHGRPTSIARGADGLPVVSYDTGARIRVAKCGDAACSSANTITTVDTVDYYSDQVVSIALGADGLPIISFSSAAAGTLKVIKCGSPACG